MKPKTILVVEDDPLVRSYVCMVLDTLSLPHIGVSDGDEAIAAMDSNAEGIALVLLDLTLSCTSGWNVAQELAARKPTVPIILMSGHAIDDVENPVASGKITGFLQKPFSPDQLLQTIEPILANSKPLPPT